MFEIYMAKNVNHNIKESKGNHPKIIRIAKYRKSLELNIKGGKL